MYDFRSGEYVSYTADRAVDGNLGQRLHSGLCAQPDSLVPDISSERGTPAWWRVDLGNNPYLVRNVTVYFPTDCCPDLINGTVVKVGTQANVSTHWECASFSGTATIQSVRCQPAVPVRYVSVHHRTSAYMGLCEVIVHGDALQDTDSTVPTLVTTTLPTPVTTTSAPPTVEVYLVDGEDTRHGRVVVRYGGVNGTVCNRNFDDNTARVICLMLGYNATNATGTTFRYGPGTGPVWLEGVRCVGNETNIAQCPHRGWGNTTCSHEEDAMVWCGPPAYERMGMRNFSVYLVGGKDKFHGRIVINNNGVNGTVCDDDFDYNDARVICRMVGYDKSDVEVVVSQYGPGSGPIWLDMLQCRGDETSITDCPHDGLGTHDCVHQEDVGVNCGLPGRTRMMRNITVYLVGGRDRFHGRVIVNNNGINGTVCNDHFDNNDARVICRMIGYDGSDVASAGTKYGPGNGTIWLDMLQCRGDEASIIDCPHQGLGVHDCIHLEDVGVDCGLTGLPPTLTDEVSVSLVGSGPYHGNVLLTYEGYNYTVCSLGFALSDARVICRILGYRGAYIAATNSTADPNGIHVQRLDCNGVEQSIVQCAFVGWGRQQCAGGTVAAVDCGPRVSLEGGPDRYHGRVVITYEGVPGTICDTDFGLQDARVICRMIGYPRRDVAVAGRTYGPGTGRIWLDRLRCAGNESSVDECRHPGLEVANCTHAQDVGVRCGVDISVRLVGGRNRFHGRLLVDYQGLEGTVCANKFGEEEARVVCRMLNHDALEVSTRYYGPGMGKILLDNVQCLGNETSLAECMHNGWGKHGCFHTSDVGIDCGREVIRVQLEDGPSRLNGRVVVSVDGQEGTVCVKNFTLEDARVVCSMMGYSGTNISLESYGPGTGPVWMDGPRCRGDERDLSLCPHAGLGLSTCSHYGDIGVNCGYVDMTVRLVDGLDALHGRVLITRHGQDGRVCRRFSSRYNLANAAVVCAMLGYTGSQISTFDYGSFNEKIFLSYLDCDGNETDLNSCRTSIWGPVLNDPSTCRDLGVNCGPLPLQAVRVHLEGGLDNLHGRVVLTFEGQQGTICDSSTIFGANENRLALVLCRMLGYSGNDVEAWRYPEGRGEVLLGNVLCTGNESSVSECMHRGWRRPSCTHSTDLAINCGIPPASEVKVRLEGGLDRLHGRVILTYQGREGTVCNVGFSTTYTARVICWMLNYYGTDVRAQSYGPGRGPILLNYVTCQSTHTHITSCTHRGWGVSTGCSHARDLGVNCGPAILPENAVVVLKDGLDALHGRVVLRTPKDEQSTLCDPSTRFGLTQSRIAQVVCRSKGYNGSDVSVWRYPGPSSLGLFRGLVCRGNETTLSECPMNRFFSGACRHAYDLGVGCGLQNVQVRLEDGLDRLHGRVVVNFQGIEGTVCDDGFGISEATVICRMLGYFDSDVSITRHYGPGQGQIWLRNLQCDGTESSLEQCTHPGWGLSSSSNHSEDVGVHCGNITTTSLSITLVDGSDSLHGRVVVNNTGQLGALCASGFEAQDAAIICNMLGYNGSDVSFEKVAARTEPWTLEITGCHGTESHLTQCEMSGWKQAQCPGAGEVVTLSCGAAADRRNDSTTNYETCGERFSTKIFGGTPAITAWPWMVSVQNASTNTHFIGGVIVAPKWVLTSGYGVSRPGVQLNIIAGTSTLNSRGRATTNGVTISVRKIILHPDYGPYNFDLALLELDQPLTFNAAIRPVCLSPQDAIPTGTCYATGWGSTTRFGSFSTRLQQTIYPIVNTRNCRFEYSPVDDSSSLCAGYASGSSDFCRGDTGGPVVCARTNSDIFDIYGVLTRWTRTCGDTYTILTQVYSSRQWIRQVISQP